jgi:HEPN domain-containing protein
MEKKIVLEHLFDKLVADIETKKQSLVDSLLRKNYETCKTSNFEAVIAHLFLQIVSEYDLSHPDETNLVPTDSTTEWYLKKAVKINTHEAHVKQKTDSDESDDSHSTDSDPCPPHFGNILSTSEIKFQNEKKVQAKKTNKNQTHLQYAQSKFDLDCAFCLHVNEFFPQSVHASQQAAEKSLKSVLKAKCIPALLWKSEHSLKKLFCTLGIFNERLNRLCIDLEFLGIDAWKNTHKRKISTLAIRARYCDSNNSSFIYVDTFPSHVFDKDMSLNAYIMAKKIVAWCKTLMKREFANDPDLHKKC